MLMGFGAQLARKEKSGSVAAATAGDTKARAAAETKDIGSIINTLLTVGGVAMLIEWLTAAPRGGDGIISSAVGYIGDKLTDAWEWLTDEQVRIEARLDALAEKLAAAEESGADTTSLREEEFQLEKWWNEIEDALAAAGKYKDE